MVAVTVLQRLMGNRIRCALSAGGNWLKNHGEAEHSRHYCVTHHASPLLDTLADYFIDAHGCKVKNIASSHEVAAMSKFSWDERAATVGTMRGHPRDRWRSRLVFVLAVIAGAALAYAIRQWMT
jgi:hypothetical protein